MKTWQPPLLCGLALCACACSLANDRRPCDDVQTTESQVNERQDQEELLDSSHSAAEVDEARVFVTWTAQDVQPSSPPTMSLRYGIVGRASGRMQACHRSSFECEMADAGELPLTPSVAKAPLAIAGQEASALIAWIDGAISGERYVRMRFIDAGGNVLGLEGAFDPFGQPMYRVDVAWSETARSVVAVAQDERDLWLRKVDAPGTATPRKLASGTTTALNPIGIVGAPALGVARDGRMLVAWFDAVSGYRVLALSSEGEPQGQPRAAGLPGAVTQSKYGAPLAIAVASDHFAVVGASSQVVDAPFTAFFQEFAFDGRPLHAARAIDASDAGHQTAVNAVYLPHDTLLVTWHSATHHGVVGRFFDADGSPRFCSLGCDEAPFVVGTRADTTIFSSSMPLLNGDDLWVIHDGKDGRGDGVHLLRAPFASLYPVKQ